VPSLWRPRRVPLLSGHTVFLPRPPSACPSSVRYESLLPKRICQLSIRIHHDPVCLELIACSTRLVVFAPFHPLVAHRAHQPTGRAPSPYSKCQCEPNVAAVSPFSNSRPVFTFSRDPHSFWAHSVTVTDNMARIFDGLDDKRRFTDMKCFNIGTSARYKFP
jgi:hypothetical protein